MATTIPPTVNTTAAAATSRTGVAILCFPRAIFSLIFLVWMGQIWDY
ncbi:MAG: hypothetical protein ACT4NY_26385 [Pseudonocardiales bacterium]